MYEQIPVELCATNKIQYVQKDKSINNDQHYQPIQAEHTGYTGKNHCRGKGQQPKNGAEPRALNQVHHQHHVDLVYKLDEWRAERGKLCHKIDRLTRDRKVHGIILQTGGGGHGLASDQERDRLTATVKSLNEMLSCST